MSIFWIILGIVGLVVLAVIIYSVIWVFANLSKGRKDPEHFEKMKQKSEEQIRKNDEQIRKNDERIQELHEQNRQDDEYLAQNKQSRKVLAELNTLAARNIFTEDEMREITKLSNCSAELSRSHTALLASDGMLITKGTKITRRQTQIATTFREKKRDELQPELEELDAKVRELDAQSATLNEQIQAQRLEIYAVDSAIEKWVELGRSRLSK